MSGGGTQTSTSQTSVDPAVSAMQKQLFDNGTSMLSGFLNNPSYSVADFSPDQSAGFDLSRYLAKSSFSPDNSVAPISADSARATAAQLDPKEIQQFMNPYMGNVLDRADRNIMRTRNESAAQADAAGAASSPFGGSGPAIQKAMLDRNALSQVADTNANLLSSGWQQAAGLAGQNAGYRQQAAMFNPTAAMQSAQINNGLLNDQQTRQLKGLQQLLQTGDLQQKQGQNILNVPFDALSKLNAITPKQVGTSTSSTTPDNTPNPMMQLAPMLLSLFL